MKKIILIKCLIVLNCLNAIAQEPSEYLKINFKDATGSEDSVIVGFYDDTCYYNSCEAIVSLGIDTAFGEIQMVSIPPSTFSARVILDSGVVGDSPSDVLLYNTYLKKDIRYGDFVCGQGDYFNIYPHSFDIKFYNAVYPVISNISIYRNGFISNIPNIYSDSLETAGCFCDYFDTPSTIYNHDMNGWCRSIIDTNGSEIYNSGMYDINYNPGLFDTICCENIMYYSININFMYINIDLINKNNLIIYPNITNSYIYIKGTNKYKIERIIIYNIYGYIISDMNYNKKEINVRYLIPGIYFINLLDKQNNIIYKSKFIKL